MNISAAMKNDRWFCFRIINNYQSPFFTTALATAQDICISLSLRSNAIWIHIVRWVNDSAPQNQFETMKIVHSNNNRWHRLVSIDFTLTFLIYSRRGKYERAATHTVNLKKFHRHLSTESLSYTIYIYHTHRQNAKWTLFHSYVCEGEFNPINLVASFFFLHLAFCRAQTN